MNSPGLHGDNKSQFKGSRSIYCTVLPPFFVSATESNLLDYRRELLLKVGQGGVQHIEGGVNLGFFDDVRWRDQEVVTPHPVVDTRGRVDHAAFLHGDCLEAVGGLERRVVWLLSLLVFDQLDAHQEALAPDIAH